MRCWEPVVGGWRASTTGQLIGGGWECRVGANAIGRRRKSAQREQKAAGEVSGARPVEARCVAWGMASGVGEVR